MSYSLIERKKVGSNYIYIITDGYQEFACTSEEIRNAFINGAFEVKGLHLSSDNKRILMGETKAPTLRGEVGSMYGTLKVEACLDDGLYLFRCVRCNRTYKKTWHVMSEYAKWNKKGCPLCQYNGVGKDRIKRTLSEVPEIAQFYMNERNVRNSNEISAHSQEKAWFYCPKCGEGYKCTIVSKVKTGCIVCPKCKKRELNAEQSKQVRCVETGAVYMSIKLAAKAHNLSDSTLGNALRNKGTAGGYHWEYVYTESVR